MYTKLSIPERLKDLRVVDKHLTLEQLAAELQARSEEMQAQLLRTPRIVGPRRMLRAYPKLRHGSKLRSLPTLREMLHRAEQENKDDNKNTK